jgi:hypothetical protein
MFLGLHVRYPILTKSGVSRQIVVKHSVPNFIKIRPMKSELIHEERQTDGRTDMTNATEAFCDLLKRAGNLVSWKE